MTETLRRQSLWDRTGCPSNHRYAVSSIKNLKEVFCCFLPIKLTHFALWVIRLNSRVYILLTWDDWAVRLSTSQTWRGEGVLPLSSIHTFKTRTTLGKIRAVWWIFACKTFYFPALMEEFLFSWERPTKQKLSTSFWRDAEVTYQQCPFFLPVEWKAAPLNSLPQEANN